MEVLREIYVDLQETWPELPVVKTKQAMIESLQTYEAENPLKMYSYSL